MVLFRTLGAIMKQYLFVIIGIVTIVVLLAAGGGQISPPYNPGGGGAVSSVFGRTGTIVAAVGDYSAFFPTSVYCGLTTTCANTAQSGAKIVHGFIPATSFTGAGPATATVTLSAASAFSDTTYECSFVSHNNAGTVFAITLNKVSGTSFSAIMANQTDGSSPGTNDKAVGYICTGN